MDLDGKLLILSNFATIISYKTEFSQVQNMY